MTALYEIIIATATLESQEISDSSWINLDSTLQSYFPSILETCPSFGRNISTTNPVVQRPKIPSRFPPPLSFDPFTATNTDHVKYGYPTPPSKEITPNLREHCENLKSLLPLVSSLLLDKILMTFSRKRR
jgi:hypothetical protein